MASSINFWTVAAAVTCVKFLLIPSYRSTDFEVHRNWLAITHTRPISKWYYESTSEWTLDYPPLFAWFEYGLSYFAKFFDPAMLQVSNKNYASPQTIFFQRLTVIIADLVYILGAKQLCNIVASNGRKKESPDPWMHKDVILAMLLLWNPGLLLVDHIHFQYNGFLYGFLLLSIACMINERYLLSAFWFAVLLNMKHLYLYIAPVYFVYLLKNYCFQNSSKDGTVDLKSFSILNFIKLGAVVLFVFSISFGPFIYLGQISQIFSRLFPFNRGLSHAYWAPNFWALYNAADKAVSVAAVKLNIPIQNVGEQAVMTGGLVQEFHHQVLPSVGPSVTFILTLLSLLPSLWVLWTKPNNPWMFVQSLILCAFGSFLFGFHIHEKAILMALLPLTILSVTSQTEAKIYAFLAPVAHFSLFPLLFKEAEAPIKIFLLLLHSVYTFTILSRLHRFPKEKKRLPLLTTLESVYVLGLVAVQAFYSFGNKLLGIEHLPFLPLMLISCYCAIGIIYSWAKMYFLLYPGNFPLFLINGKKNS